LRSKKSAKIRKWRKLKCKMIIILLFSIIKRAKEEKIKGII